MRYLVVRYLPGLLLLLTYWRQFTVWVGAVCAIGLCLFACAGFSLFGSKLPNVVGLTCPGQQVQSQVQVDTSQSTKSTHHHHARRLSRSTTAVLIDRCRPVEVTVWIHLPVLATCITGRSTHLSSYRYRYEFSAFHKNVLDLTVNVDLPHQSTFRNSYRAFPRDRRQNRRRPK